MPARSQSVTQQKQLNSFGKLIDAFLPWLEEQYGREVANMLASDSIREYVALLPNVPDLGNNPQVRLFFEPTPRYLAVYRAMIKLGYTTEEIGQVIYAMGSRAIEHLPGPVRRFAGWLWFNRLFKRLLRRRAAITQSSPHPQGYIIEYIDGQGQDFNYGIDYLECASLKYLATNNALSIAPYICAIDKVASEMMGWGLRRDTALADGCERCEFRFTRGGPTHVPLPAGLY